MSDTNELTVPRVGSFFRWIALAVWFYLAPRVWRLWCGWVGPIKAYWAKKYLFAAVMSGISRPRARQYQAMYETIYHQPAWQVLLLPILVDVVLLLGLLWLGWRMDYRSIIKLRRGKHLTGPVLHKTLGKFRRAISNE